MRMTMSRSLNYLVEEQLAKWHAQRSVRKKQAGRPGPCITISRDPGSGGSETARRLAKDLGMDIIGAQIIQQVAERADMSEKVIASLDEKEVRLRDSWIDSLFQTRHIWPDEYLRYLTKVIGTIGKQGNAVIVGRGAQFILPPEETFRIRLTAPRDIRIRNVMRDSGEDLKASERYVYKTESDRDAFHRKHFRADWTNLGYYDLIVNTGHMGVEGAVAAIKAAFAVWKNLPYKQSPSPSSPLPEIGRASCRDRV
jgi:cytidylate kinase